MSKRITDLDILSSPTGDEYMNYILGATDQNMKLKDLANSITGNGILYYTSRTLTSTEISNLVTTPITLIDAPGSNKILAIHQVVATLTDGTLFNGFDIITTRYNSGSDHIIILGGVLSTNSGVYVEVSNGTASPVLIDNTSYEIYDSSGAGTGDRELTINIWYYIISI